MRIFGIYYPDTPTTEAPSEADTNLQNDTNGPSTDSFIDSADTASGPICPMLAEAPRLAGQDKSTDKETGKSTGSDEDADSNDGPGLQLTPEQEAWLSEARERFASKLARERLEQAKAEAEAQREAIEATLPPELVKAARASQKKGSLLSQAVAAESKKRWLKENEQYMKDYCERYKQEHPEWFKEKNRRSQAAYLERLRRNDPEKYRAWVQHTGELHKQANARKRAEKEAAKLAEQEAQAQAEAGLDSEKNERPEAGGDDD